MAIALEPKIRKNEADGAAAQRSDHLDHDKRAPNRYHARNALAAGIAG